MNISNEHDHETTQRHRGELQERIAEWMDLPLSVLAVIMLGLLLLELLADLSPLWRERVIQAQFVIWAVFVAEFVVELALAPSKRDYLRKNWLTALSVALPALRSVRVFRAARALRGLNLLRMITVLNRGTGAIGQVFRRGQFGYVLALTIAVTVTAAAGAYYLERDASGATITSPGDALWWAATIVTTVNAPLEVVTLEGRIIGLLLRIYGIAVAGYITAVIAAYLLGGPWPAPPQTDPEEMRQLRQDIQRLTALLEERRIPEERQQP